MMVMNNSESRPSMTATCFTRGDVDDDDNDNDDNDNDDSDGDGDGDGDDDNDDYNLRLRRQCITRRYLGFLAMFPQTQTDIFSEAHLNCKF